MPEICKPIDCQAAILWKPKGPLTVETITVRPPCKSEVRVKIVASGVCHSDLVDYSDSGMTLPSDLFPYVPGHEGAGIVESVGENVTKVKVGDKVLVMFFGRCGDCSDCVKGVSNYCKISMRNGQLNVNTNLVPFMANGKNCFRFCGASTFSEYTLVEQDRVVKIDQDDVDLRKICLLACGIPTGYGSAVNISGVTKGSTVAIWGLGTLGLAAGLGASHKEASMIVGVDLHSEKFALAQKFGFTHFVNPKELELGKSTVDAIKDLTGGHGVDHTVCCVGVWVAMKEAVESLSHAATSKAALVGCSPPGTKIAVDLDLIYSGATITGGRYGNFKHGDINGLIEKTIEGKIDLDQFITSTRPLEEIKEAFDDLTAAKVLRTIIILDHNYSP